ncbi:MAG: hypothetical protein Q4D51_13045 [Eubacteriales bacterium]|nr:hypothetical protein [Eubacteriales bacterium]
MKKVTLISVVALLGLTLQTGCSPFSTPWVTDMDEFYSVDEKYQSNQVVKISKNDNNSNGTSLEVDYNGQNATSVKNVNNHPDVKGDLILDAEYIFGGGPKPPEYNYYLKRYDGDYYNIYNDLGDTWIRLEGDDVEYINYRIIPSGDSDNYDCTVRFDISGDFEVSSNDADATLSCEFWSYGSGWISLNALSANTSFVNNNGVLKFVSNLSGDVAVEIDKNHKMISGTVNMTAGKVYYIDLNDMSLLDADGNELEI